MVCLLASRKSPFEILGVDKFASEKEVKDAYFRLVKVFNPERHGEKFKEIREAYEALRDGERRSELVVFEFTNPYGDFDPEETRKICEYHLDFEITPQLMVIDKEGMRPEE